MKISSYERNPFYVEVVEVDAENLEEAAAWCGGEIITSKVLRSGKPEQHIKVDVNNPKTDRQTKAFIGDFILRNAETGFKVYTAKAFAKSFTKTDLQIVLDQQEKLFTEDKRETSVLHVTHDAAELAGITPGQAPVFMTPAQVRDRLREV